MIDPRRIENLKAWIKTQRQNYKNMILGDDDASQWCADEVERIDRHIQTIELLETALEKACEGLEEIRDIADLSEGVEFYSMLATKRLKELKGEK